MAIQPASIESGMRLLIVTVKKLENSSRRWFRKLEMNFQPQEIFTRTSSGEKISYHYTKLLLKGVNR